MHIAKRKKQVGKGYILYDWFQLYNILEKGKTIEIAKISVIARSLRQEREEGKEGNGTPLQYSCLENPIDGGDW